MPNDSSKWLKDFKSNLAKAVETIGDIGLEVLKDSVSTPYPPVSQPGTEPHLRTGELRDGLGVNINGIDITYSSSASYSDDLEFGTSKMQPRPFMRPHKQWMKQNFTTLLKEELEK